MSKFHLCGGLKGYRIHTKYFLLNTSQQDTCCCVLEFFSYHKHPIKQLGL